MASELELWCVCRRQFSAATIILKGFFFGDAKWQYGVQILIVVLFKATFSGLRVYLKAASFLGLQSCSIVSNSKPGVF
jgi:hypothetical protein